MNTWYLVDVGHRSDHIDLALIVIAFLVVLSHPGYYKLQIVTFGNLHEHLVIRLDPFPVFFNY